MSRAPSPAGRIPGFEHPPGLLRVGMGEHDLETVLTGITRARNHPLPILEESERCECSDRIEAGAEPGSRAIQRFRALHREHGKIGALLQCHVSLKTPTHPVEVLFTGRGIHDKTPAAVPTIDDKVIENAAILVEQCRVLGAARRLKPCYVVRQQLAQPRRGVLALHVDNRHVRDIKNAGRPPHRMVFLELRPVVQRHLPTMKVDELRVACSVLFVESGSVHGEVLQQDPIQSRPSACSAKARLTEAARSTNASPRLRRRTPGSSAPKRRLSPSIAPKARALSPRRARSYRLSMRASPIRPAAGPDAMSVSTSVSTATSFRPRLHPARKRMNDMSCITDEHQPIIYSDRVHLKQRKATARCNFKNTTEARLRCGSDSAKSASSSERTDSAAASSSDQTTETRWRHSHHPRVAGARAGISMNRCQAVSSCERSTTAVVAIATCPMAVVRTGTPAKPRSANAIRRDRQWRPQYALIGKRESRRARQPLGAVTPAPVTVSTPRAASCAHSRARIVRWALWFQGKAHRAPRPRSVSSPYHRHPRRPWRGRCTPREAHPTRRQARAIGRSKPGTALPCADRRDSEGG